VLVFVPHVKADAQIDNALNFLKSKQDATGRITTGFSAPSQWSAIAFASNGIDVATVTNPTISLKTFLESDIPASPSAATDWEPRILAIVAIGGDPTNFGGVNYVANLESFANGGQMGDICSLNDDIFGLLALIAAGSAADDQIKKEILAYLIAQQDPTDGGFSFSAQGCDWYATSADMTGAAVQALVAAKEHGMVDSGLQTAIDKAKAYLLTNQSGDGGFGYFGFSDTDTTGWVLQALNVLGMENSPEAASASAYLRSQISSVDGGITAFDWGTSTFVSNASTTAQGIIALSGNGWIIRIFDPALVASSSATPTLTVTVTPTVTPTPTSTPSNNPTSTPTPTPTPSPAVQEVIITFNEFVDGPFVPQKEEEESVVDEFTVTPTGTVLGAQDEKIYSKNPQAMFFAGMFTGFGLLFIFLYFAKPFIIKKFL
ncbi:MAG TPA: prenyltransferase/squalene oxidase repeat-containing protein, partial [Patescibacteria group bacterium]|nr:prenyltransferase/squalene oxidase repeat-containing protein [Patescibacteria group bacterium]